MTPPNQTSLSFSLSLSLSLMNKRTKALELRNYIQEPCKLNTWPLLASPVHNHLQHCCLSIKFTTSQTFCGDHHKEGSRYDGECVSYWLQVAAHSLICLHQDLPYMLSHTNPEATYTQSCLTDEAGVITEAYGSLWLPANEWPIDRW